MSQGQPAGSARTSGPPQKPLRAAFIANGNPRDLKLWSGTPYHMLRALEQRFEMVTVVQDLWPAWYRPVGRALKLLTARRFEYSWSRWYSNIAARRTIRRLRQAAPDVVFSVALTDMAYLFVDKVPVVTITDAIIPDLIEYYDMFRVISPTAKRRAAAAEREAFHRSMLVHFPSRWACRSAIDKQDVPPERVVEIAWGANMPAKARQAREIGAGPVRLLFVGSHWDRKGGPIAMAAAAALVARGVDCHLDVIGCTQAVVPGPVPPFVTFHGFIDKETDEGKAQLESFYACATLFILPSLAEAWGIVFAEAAHHGLPSLALATGGVTSVVLDGKTGILLPQGATGRDFADRIQALIQEPERYAAMSRAALEDARDRLDWDVWAERLEQAVRARLIVSRPEGA
jgi:glycosyltransferase involved in cell wall biosynthesis